MRRGEQYSSAAVGASERELMGQVLVSEMACVAWALHGRWAVRGAPALRSYLIALAVIAFDFSGALRARTTNLGVGFLCARFRAADTINEVLGTARFPGPKDAVLGRGAASINLVAGCRVTTYRL